jgi:hypothetical protein
MDMNENTEIQRQQRMALALRLGIEVLSTRLMTLLALLLSFGMFGYAMYAGGWERLASAFAFAVCSWCLINVRPEK